MESFNFNDQENRQLNYQIDRLNTLKHEMLLQAYLCVKIGSMKNE